MDILNLILEAIENRKSISFQYNREGRDNSMRIANPYVIYKLNLRAGGESIRVHMFQTSGKGGWRHFNLEYISNLKILKNEEYFELSLGLNPKRQGYQHIIKKIAMDEDEEQLYW